MLSSTIARRGRHIGRALASFSAKAPAAIAATGAYQNGSGNHGSQDKQHFSARAMCFLAAGICGIGASVNVAHNEGAQQPVERKWPMISRQQVLLHNNNNRGMWVSYKNSVYDITKFVNDHPGGREKLESVAGQDIGDAWATFRNHLTSPLAHELLEGMKIGELHPSEVIAAPEPVYKPKYSTDAVYDVIIVGAGLSGLQCGSALVNAHGVNKEKILLLEAQDYVGGRVKQMTEFIKGTKVEVGAEFLHGNNTELTKFARANGEPLREIYCWAHGDGGPLPEAADNGYGLYYVGATKPAATTGPIGAAGDLSQLPYQPTDTDIKLNSKDRLLRYDDPDADFVALNKALWDLAEMNENDFDESLSLYDYLVSKKLNPNMLKMGAAGFSNTLCSNSYELSLKQAIKWSRIWHNEGGEDEEDGDYTFKNSYSCLIDHLSKGLQIEINTPIAQVTYDDAAAPAAAAGCPHAKSSDTKGLVTVTTKDGAVYRARKLVVTASPHVINSKLIQFNPALPAEVAEAYTWTLMNPITKVIMKFKEPCWPKDLHGMIMVDDDFLLPEVWFRHVPDEVEEGEPTAYAVGFTTAKYTERLQGMTQQEVLKRCVGQLEKVFSHLEQRHMSAEHADAAPSPKALPKASEVYVGGMFWDWRPAHHPYIGGGYCSPRVNKPITSGETLSKPWANNRLFFAGEATNDRPGATAHAALETGLRAAAHVAAALKE